MASAGQRNDQTGEPARRLARPGQTSCWHCQAPDPEGWTRLGPATQGGGTRVPVCAEGQGCKDGRVFHGPMGAPHFPDQDCPICGPAEKQRAMQRNAGTVGAVVRPGRNSKKRPPR